MIAVVLEAKGSGGKTYRLANMNDESLYQKTRIVLDKKSEELANIWGISPIPDEEIPTTELRRISLPLYGMNKWSDMHNDRQLLALVVLTDQIRKAHETIKAANVDQELAKAVTTYLAIMVNRLVDRNSVLCRVIPQTEAIGFTFARQALGMLWDYIEISPLDHLSGWKNITNDIIQVLLSCNINSGRYVWCNDVTQASATQLPYPENYFDAVLTDPPYYDNVPYSHLSDIFYVWLKRTVGYLYPELFSTPLTPKSLEIVQDRSHSRSKSVKTKQYFEQMLTRAFSEIYRVLKPDNPAIVVYAHKSTDGWETLINALLDSGLVMTGAWPLNTEFGVRLGAQDTASLASSIYIVARKMPRQPSGFYTDIRSELRRHLDTRLNRLWNEGIGGADFFIAAIGSAIEVFGKYKQVIDYEGNIVRADRLLEEVRVIATDYAVRQILHNGFATEISGLTRLYVLWRWNYGEALVPFDEGRKLAQSCGIDLAQEWGKGGFVKKEKEFIRLLGPQGRKLEDLDDPRDLIDVLHKALLLWEKGKRSEMVMALVDRDYGRSEAFYRVAQAISETLPNESKEKKLLDGFLAGRERVQEEVGKVVKQGRLWN
jgi:adenine-specific DNA methylase